MGRMTERFFWLSLLVAPIFVGLALAAPTGPINYAAINGVTGALSYAPATGLFSQATFSNLSGSVACSQMPALTGGVTSPAGSCATTTATQTNSKTITFDSTTTMTAQNISFAAEWTSYTLTGVQAYGSAGSGTYTVTVKINAGSALTGCNAASVTADGSNHDLTCTGSNTGSKDDIINVALGAPSGTVTSPVYVAIVFAHTVN